MNITIFTKTANSSNDDKTNNILHFSNVSYWEIKDGVLTFTYMGVRTGKVRKAVFLLSSIAGHAVDKQIPEPVEDTPEDRV